MTSFPRFEFRTLYEKGYSDGYSQHGDLNLALEVYADRLSSVIENHLGANPAKPVVIDFFQKLYTNDLYLTVACAQGGETAWERFVEKYGCYIKDLGRFASGSADLGIEVADRVMINLFLPDHSGLSHIASFDGRISLGAWLRVIINYQASKERKRKCNNLEPLEGLPEATDEVAMDTVYAMLRVNRYEPYINDALQEAIERLSVPERAMLLMRYEEELKATEIARVLGVCPSTVTRALQTIQQKIRDEVASILFRKHRLSDDAIKECFIAIIENGGYSILAVVKLASNEAAMTILRYHG